MFNQNLTIIQDLIAVNITSQVALHKIFTEKFLAREKRCAFIDISSNPMRGTGRLECAEANGRREAAFLPNVGNSPGSSQTVNASERRHSDVRIHGAGRPVSINRRIGKWRRPGRATAPTIVGNRYARPAQGATCRMPFMIIQ